MQCTKVCSFSSRHGGRFHCGYEVSHAIDTPIQVHSGIFSMCTVYISHAYYRRMAIKGCSATIVCFSELRTVEQRHRMALPIGRIFMRLERTPPIPITRAGGGGRGWGGHSNCDLLYIHHARLQATF